MGMIAADMQIVIRYRSRAFFCAAVATVIYAAALVFLLKDRLALDEALFGWLLRVNPPGITMTVYSLAVIFLIFSGCSLGALMNHGVVSRILAVSAWLGRYTLYIFLYHMLILEYLPAMLPFLSEISPLKTIVYLGAMIGLPVGGKLLYDTFCRRLMKKAIAEAVEESARRPEREEAELSRRSG